MKKFLFAICLLHLTACSVSGGANIGGGSNGVGIGLGLGTGFKF